MERVSTDDPPSSVRGDGVEVRRLSDPLGTTDVSINRYRVPPGERVSGLHAHADQEEVFVVIDGEATFETDAAGRDGDDRGGGAGDSRRGDAGPFEAVVVGEGGAVRFAPGEFQSCANGADVDLHVLALGAPPGTEDVRVPVACPDCGHGDLAPTVRDGEVVLACPDCEREHATRGCPECDRDELRAVAGDGGAVVACPDCGARLDRPRFA